MSKKWILNATFDRLDGGGLVPSATMTPSRRSAASQVRLSVVCSAPRSAAALVNWPRPVPVS